MCQGASDSETRQNLPGVCFLGRLPFISFLVAPKIVVVEFHSSLAHHLPQRKGVSFPFKPDMAPLQLILPSNIPQTFVLGYEILLPSVFSS